MRRAPNGMVIARGETGPEIAEAHRSVFEKCAGKLRQKVGAALRLQIAQAGDDALVKNRHGGMHGSPLSKDDAVPVDRFLAFF